MSTQQQMTVKVGRFRFSDELERHVGMVSVEVGPFTIHKVSIWRSKGGKLNVAFPAQREGRVWLDLVDMPADLRAEIEAKVIAACKEAKTDAKNLKEQGDGDDHQ